ncbi:lysylphosphatidylglycerol synthase domain-containing protein [Aphanothece hegewaldii]|nr:lysylphosphatidylglycerol synthase domain-containing protein [Aphanothece hegewaldii]
MIRLRQLLPILFTLVILGLATWAVAQEFKNYTFQDFLDSLAQIPPQQKLGSIVVTFIGYLSMTGYDWLGFCYVNRMLKLRHIIETSFISYAVGNTVGFTLLSGTAIRYRFYSAFGVPPFDIAKIVAFTHLEFWLGMLTIGGFIFLLDPLNLSDFLKFPLGSVKAIGILFLLIVIIYFTFSIFCASKTLKIKGEELKFPSFGLSLGLIVASLIDWVLAATVLYLLLPEMKISFLGFFGIYVFALTAGVVSTVPGGLGVFDYAIAHLLAPFVPKPELGAALIAYRGIYHFLPLIVAVVLLLGREWRHHVK